MEDGGFDAVSGGEGDVREDDVSGEAVTSVDARHGVEECSGSGGGC